MKDLSSKENKDRLETINSMLFAIPVLERSIRGWRRWIGNLSLMSQFTLEELANIEESLQTQVQSFVEYDVTVTGKWQAKFPQIPRSRGIEGVQETRRGLIV